MRGNVIKFAQQGLWASLSGGWCFDSRFSDFNNVFHLYTWLFLICLPFILYVISSLTWAILSAYLATILLFFSALKYVNSYLHSTFDGDEQVQKCLSSQKDDKNEGDGIGSHLDETVRLGDEAMETSPTNISCKQENDDSFNKGDASVSNLPSKVTEESFSGMNEELVMQMEKTSEQGKRQQMMFLSQAKEALADVHVDNPSLGKSNMMEKAKQMKVRAVDRCTSVDSVSDSSHSEDLTEVEKEMERSSSSLEEDRPSTSKDVWSGRMQRRVGFRKHVRPPKFSQAALPHVSEKPVKSTDDKVTEQKDNLDGSHFSSGDNQFLDIATSSKVCCNELGGGESIALQARPDLPEGVLLQDLEHQDASGHKQVSVEKKGVGIASRSDISLKSTATTPLGGSIRDMLESSFICTPPQQRQCADDISKAEPSSLGSSKQTIQDDVNTPLLTGKPGRKKEFVKLNLEHSEVKKTQGACDIEHERCSSDSDNYVVDASFGQSVKNFEQGQGPRGSEPMQRGHHNWHSERGRATNQPKTLRSISFPQSDYSFRVENGQTSSTRHRHPAGDPFSFDDSPMRDSRLSRSPSAGSQQVRERQGKLHLATSHTDTSEGAVHSFQDEHGNWLTYTFASDGLGVATDLSEQDMPFHPSSSHSSRIRSRRQTRDDSTSSISTRGLSMNNDAPVPYRSPTDHHLAGLSQLSRRSASREQHLLFDALRRSIDTGQRIPSFPGPDTSPSTLLSQLDISRRAPSPKIKLFYKVKILPWKSITIQYDRLALMDLLDRNVRLLESVLSVFLALLVALLGSLVLTSSLLHDIWTFWFCVVIATAQYSLIKSVQPDSASPTHGHNRIIAYSRPVYFIMSTSLLLLCDYLSDPIKIPITGLPLYGVMLFNNTGFAMARDFMLVFTLLLPVVFLFGLLPQVNTLLMYICEQLEIHAFGGAASTSLVASLFSVGRSILFLSVLFGFCYGGITQEGSQHILFSVFCGFLVSSSYHLSRQITSPAVLWSIIKLKVFGKSESHSDGESPDDPAKDADNVSNSYLIDATIDRLESDIVLCILISIAAFALHSSSLFTVFKDPFHMTLLVLVGVFGFMLHYLLPQMRRNLPWLFFARPLLKSHEYDLFEVTESARLMWFEKFYVFASFIERNVIFPLFVMNLLTKQASTVVGLYGPGIGSAITTVVGMKLLRNAFCVPSMQYIVYLASFLFVHYDRPMWRQDMLITFFLCGILFVKIQELVLKLHFWLVYISPWQVTWGSAFHAFAQPCVVPHSAFLTAHAIFAAIVQAPFVPFLGSSIFLSSYARPIKFWEKNYKTKRIDHSNTRLSSQLDRGPHSDDNNLNSIFYEHLTYSLQKSLAGDIAIGRWGNVYAGDCFILASDYLNAMVHIVERSNGIVTFQLRGLEFSGTYCQQREVEAINDGVDSSDGCCCFNLPRISGLLSFNSAFSHRWMAWEVLSSNYVLDGYSISDNSAATMLGVFDLRKILICYILKSIIYFVIAHDSLERWLDDEQIREQIQACESPYYADVDSTFAVTIDDDYVPWLFGVSLTKFHVVYGPWMEHCASERQKRTGKTVACGAGSRLLTLCFAVSVLGRRALATASNNLSSNLDSFLFGLHALFKGDFRITSSKDEWVFRDMDLLHHVVAPGVRTALKLHQDHFACPDEYDVHDTLFKAITDYTSNMVITHEGDPVWRKAVLSNTPSLLALRRVVSETYVDQYSIITLNHRALGFNVVRVNRECVRGLWAGQQSELVFLRNRNPERGSIQNAKQVLRNMVNSSCDQPIGYPIYVSPLTTSYASTNPQYTSMVGKATTFSKVRRIFAHLKSCIQQSCSGSCNSGGSAGFGHPHPPQMQEIPMAHLPPSHGQGSAREFRGPLPQLAPQRTNSNPSVVSSTSEKQGIDRKPRHSSSRDGRPHPLPSVPSKRLTSQTSLRSQTAEDSAEIVTKKRLNSNSARTFM